ncbi:MAG TPA: hypothetical protein VEB18_03265 [Candidatus Paceibacterota bacterium]|nr:hypothetical protein [Candidatus Paceibacterota bacterium]
MRTAQLLLRLGVAFAFLFPPVNALIDPYSWIGYFPTFMRGMMPEMVLLHLFGIIEIIIGLWLIWGKRIFIPSVAATVLLVLIVIFNLGDFQVLFRDLSIAAMALALAVLNRPERTT